MSKVTIRVTLLQQITGWDITISQGWVTTLGKTCAEPQVNTQPDSEYTHKNGDIFPADVTGYRLRNCKQLFVWVPYLSVCEFKSRSLWQQRFPGRGWYMASKSIRKELIQGAFFSWDIWFISNGCWLRTRKFKLRQTSCLVLSLLYRNFLSRVFIGRK